MKFLTNIFARIWAFWGLLSFVISFLIFFLPSMCSHLYKDEAKGQAFFIRVSRVWMNVWLFLVGCPLTISGEDNVEKGKFYVITFNHNALLDVPLSAPFVPGPNKTIAKASFAKVPLFGWFYKRGAILVNRKDEKSRIRSFEEMKRVLSKGMHMAIYPEGTRNRTGEPLKAFYDGAFKLAVESGHDVLPCVITGTREAMPIHQTFYLLPKKLGMHFLPAVKSAGKTAKELNAEVFELMKKTYVQKSNR